MSTPKPSIERLWQQSGGDGGRYRELMRQHGYILSPGDEGYEDGSRTLPCGWQPGTAADGHPDLLRTIAALVRQGGRQACVFDTDLAYETGTLGIGRAENPGRWLLAVRDVPPGGEQVPEARGEAEIRADERRRTLLAFAADLDDVEFRASAALAREAADADGARL